MAEKREVLSIIIQVATAEVRFRFFMADEKTEQLGAVRDGDMKLGTSERKA